MRALRRPPIFASAFALAAVLAFPPGYASALSLHADFDGASLNVAASNIAGSTVNLVPRASWTASGRTTYYRTVTFRVAGALGTTPHFRLHASPLTFYGNLTGHKFIFSYDGENWFFFSNNSGSSSDFTFYNATAFTQDVVYVSWGIPFPVSRARAMIDAYALASPHIRPAAGATPLYVVGSGSGGLDELGFTVPPQEILAANVTDERISILQKKKVVLVGGVHSGETYGNITLEGFLDFALGPDPRAVALRERAVFYVYPLVNPDGRFGGFYRSGPENPSLDYNRYWDDPTGFTDLTAVRNSMISDTGGDIDALLDFHCHFDANEPHFLYTNAISTNPLVEQLEIIRPAIYYSQISFNPGAPPQGFLDTWSGHSLGLSAEIYGTSESCPGLTRQEYLDLGRDYAIAYALSLGDADTDGDGLPDYWELTHAPSLATMSASTDTDEDGRSDGDEWLEATIPNDPGSIFSPRCAPGETAITLSWDGHAGRNYRIEQSSTLLPGSWSAALALVPGIDGPMDADLPLSPSGALYFRIITSVK